MFPGLAATGRPTGGDRSSRAVRDPGVVRPVLRFALSGLAALAVVSVAGTFVLGRLGAEEAIEDARTMSHALAVGVIEPVLSDALLDGDPDAVAAMDRIVIERVLADPIVRVKLWSPDGRIAYSDVSALVGEQFTLRPGEQQALRTGTAAASLSPLDAAENQFEQGSTELLEVYQPVRTPSGAPLLVEFYLRNDAIASSGQRIWLAFAPVVLGALAVLALLQLPLALRMSRDLRRRHHEREALLQRALEASTAERARIAADLHDGIVQDMVGLSLELAAAARPSTAQAAPSTGSIAPDDDVLRSAADRVRRTVGELRTLMIEIHPPNLESAGLEAALTDLLGRVADHGVATTLDYEAPGRLASDTEALFFRIAQEALRNVIAHAGAGAVAVRVWVGDGRANLSVEDDGRGFATAEVAARQAEGHLGLGLMRELAERAGAVLQLHSAPGNGTSVRLVGGDA